MSEGTNFWEVLYMPGQMEHLERLENMMTWKKLKGLYWSPLTSLIIWLNKMILSLFSSISLDLQSASAAFNNSSVLMGGLYELYAIIDS